MKSFEGCWTCRLRRKKCDETHPVCNACTALHITCYNDQEKPEWMDGGIKQKEMTEQLKREVKENARRYYGDRSTLATSAGAQTQDAAALPRIQGLSLAASASNVAATSDLRCDQPKGPCVDSAQKGRQPRDTEAVTQSDTVLLAFYLEHVFPYLFPFYQPLLLQGGRAWVLEMMINSPVIRKTALCQSSYFFSLAGRMHPWQTVLEQTNEAFGVLREALGILSTSGVKEHLPGAARVMSGIMQLQRFAVAISNFENCRTHLQAALALFQNILNSNGVIEDGDAMAKYRAVNTRLGPLTSVTTQILKVPSAEQAAFRFSSALLIFDDIIASTVTQERPGLYEHHRSLLGYRGLPSDEADPGPAIDLELVVGCQNWVLLCIGDIAALDAWKAHGKRAGNLNVLELVQRAAAIKESLEFQLAQLERRIEKRLSVPRDLVSVITQNANQIPMHASLKESTLATRIWAHAGLLYLFIVVSGWQPASSEARSHVDRVLELIGRDLRCPTLLRTLVWPFCVAGCLASPAQEVHFRMLVDPLQPAHVFGTAHKALEIMENVWRNRANVEKTGEVDLAACFRSQGELILLV